MDGGEIHGAVSLIPTPVTEGTSAAVTIHGLPANARIDARLYAGSSLDRLSNGSAELPSGLAAESGSFRAYGRVLSESGREVRIDDVTDGGHLVLIRANGSLVAYARIPPSS